MKTQPEQPSDMSKITIASRRIGAMHPPYIIAELSANHNHDLARAKAIMTAAAEAGTDAVKLQTYTADTITIEHDGPGFHIEQGLWAGKTLHELYAEAHTPWEWHPALFDHGRELGITVFSSPFDLTAVDFLEDLGVPAYKVASFELIDLPLIERIASTGKPMILSTGMASEEEIGEAVSTARRGGCVEPLLLHCVSGYPAPIDEADLRTIPDMARRFHTEIGLSDHTMGTAVPVAAVTLGAVIIEKHLTLARADGGPDSAFSLEPSEFKRLVADCRAAWEALGEASYSLRESEKNNRIFRRSLYVVRDVAAGELIDASAVRSIRPSHGMPPKHLPAVLGRRAKRHIARGTPLDWSLLEGDQDI